MIICNTLDKSEERLLYSDMRPEEHLLHNCDQVISTELDRFKQECDLIFDNHKLALDKGFQELESRVLVLL